MICKKVGRGGGREGGRKGGEGEGTEASTSYRKHADRSINCLPLLSPANPSTQIGFAQLPLAAVAVRFSTIAWSFLPASSWQAALSFGLLLFAVLLLSKIASGLCLTRWAAGIEEREMGKREARAREREREREREALVGSRGGGGSAI